MELASGEIREHRRYVPAQQQVADFPRLLLRQLYDEAHLAAREQRNQHAVAIQEPVAAERR
jgi:hypothetical protein